MAGNAVCNIGACRSIPDFDDYDRGSKLRAAAVWGTEEELGHRLDTFTVA